MTKSVTRLFQSFQPEHYELHIHPDRKAMAFSGSVTIRGKKVGRPSQRLTFHQNGLKITQATIVKHDKKGDKHVELSRINHHATLHEVRLHSNAMLYPGSYTITMEFEAPITRGMTGLYPCYFKHEGREEVLLATQFESHHAREVFPCIDEPEAKATFDLTLTHEKKLTPLSNTPIKIQEDTKNNLVTTTFETSPRMSSYLLAFVLGEIHSKSAKTKSGVEVNVWGTVAQPVDSFDFALDAAVRTIEFFEDYFNVPYPLPKADHIALPDFSSGAMENWGLITYREAVLLLYPDAISQSSKEIIALVIAHETSHQWFGNLVTMKWWDDLWLNESFANMMEYVAVDALYPDWHIWDSFVTAEGLSALRRDAVPGVQAVKTPVHHPDEISSLFDPSIVYAKGGRLLYMLKNYIGEEAFRKGLQAYFTAHAYKNTEGADLWKALSESSKIDVAAFMNPWLKRSGFPVVTVAQEKKELRFNQAHFLDNPTKADPERLWTVPLFIERSDAPIALEKREQTCTLDSDEYAIVNQAARGHYIVHYANEAHKSAINALIADKGLGVIDRLMMLNNSGMLARAGYDSFDNTLTLLDSYAAEDTEPVWDVMSLVIADARRFVDLDETIEPKLKNTVRRLTDAQYQRLGWNEKPDDTAADQKLRATIIGLAAYAEDSRVLEHALHLFESYKSDSSVVSAELRGIVFSVAVKQNIEGAVDYLLELHQQTNNSDLQRDIAGALTSTRQPAVANRLLGLLQDSSIVKPQDADRWLFYMLRNRYVKTEAWQWMVDNWGWIEQTYHNDKSFDYFPRYAAAIIGTKEWQKKYHEFFEPKLNMPILKRNITIGIEEIANRVAWLERDLPGVQAYFTAQKSQ